MNRFVAAILLGGTLGSALATPVARDIRGSLPVSAVQMEHDFQPLTDFDKDGCYYTAAMTLTVEPMLASRRRRCNNGVCAIMYDYYFEKDQPAWGSGHTHEWEHIIVFIRNGEVVRVAGSKHANDYNAADKGGFPKDGKRVKMVYHKEGGSTHCWRIANSADEAIENETGKWFLGRLVGYDNWPSTGLRQSMFNRWPDAVCPKIQDAYFNKKLERAMQGSAHLSGFDPHHDGACTCT